MITYKEAKSTGYKFVVTTYNNVNATGKNHYFKNLAAALAYKDLFVWDALNPLATADVWDISVSNVLCYTQNVGCIDDSLVSNIDSLYMHVFTDGAW